MAMNTSRSQNAELAEGATDSKYKKVVVDRGGSVDTATWESRRDLSQRDYGIQEAKVKALGDGTLHVTPDFVETPPTTFVATR